MQIGLTVLRESFFYHENFRAYIDGFNVYHGIDNYIKTNKLPKSFSWVNPRAVVNHFLDKHTQQLDKVYFFSAVPNHKPKDNQDRHKKYYHVLKSYCDIEVRDAYFQKKKKQITCSTKKHNGCGKKFPNTSYEEKQTDVALGVQIIRDVCIDNIDGVILVSADGDFIPVITTLLQDTQVKVKVLKPVGQYKNYAYLNKIKHHKNYSVSDVLEFHHKTSIIPDIVYDNDNNPIKNPYI